jgi:predicted nucleotidyltransferase
MNEEKKKAGERPALDKLLASLQERAKELNCLYRVEEILRRTDAPISEICEEIIKVIPPGWQYSDICQAKIVLEGVTYIPHGFKETKWVLSADIVVQGMAVGTLRVSYTKEMPLLDEGPFLKEERKLIQTIAERIGSIIMNRRISRMVSDWDSARAVEAVPERGEWPVVLKLLKQTDMNLYLQICRKMLNHLSWSGVEEAEKLLWALGSADEIEGDQEPGDWNIPDQRWEFTMPLRLGEVVFKIANEHLTDEEILDLIQRWIQEDKLSFLVQVLNRNLPLSDVADALRRCHQFVQEEPDIISSSKRGIKVALIRRFFSDELNLINIAKNFIEVSDFHEILQKVIFTAESHGRLGGKSAGLTIASQILAKKSRDRDLLRDVKVPKTWHITSDILLHFMHYNNFDEVVEQKYKEIDQVRVEYSHIIQSFKNARFPEDIIRGLTVALDDFGTRPIIVRSSSLLEDRMGSAFSGKYKSLFLANQGGKKERLEALMDAIAEVYASTFGPDPIEYRAERGLLDFSEEMAIMIQEVIGTRVGKYFFPAYAGVVVSNNEFRWSPRIHRKDGLIRLVPGLGTRAVDRLSDDYPILIAPGQPGLRVNVTADEVIRYSPKKIDVINLETNRFETKEVELFLKEAGFEYPDLNNAVSIFDGSHLRRPIAFDIDFEKNDLVLTFEGLVERTDFVKRMRAILQTLEETLGHPVDIEFASDGKDFYLLQCRAQSYSRESMPAPIPKDVPENQIVFSARRHVSNGKASEITHIVYVDPEKYAELADVSDLVAVGRAVGKLNKMLPKRKFILMGPGRWGSRGDIKLGVNVTYSEINNTAVLVEIARRKGGYVPDLSFGTHFFQDLVEANIRYLPLYPDDDGCFFNERFLRGSKNILSELLPDFAHLSDTLRLIDIPQNTDGMTLQVLMNADLDEALGILTPPRVEIETPVTSIETPVQTRDVYSRWRMLMVERIASELDSERFGVAGFYVFGSTKTASAGPMSDIDVLIHFCGTPSQREMLLHWFEGWSLCLAEMNYLRTGYRTQDLLDVHIVTDADIAQKTSWAAKIGAVTDPARPIPMKKRID